MVHHMATGNLDQRIRAGSRPGQTDRLLRFQRQHRHRHPGAMIGEAEADHHLARDRPDGGSAPKLIYRGEGRRMDEDLGTWPRSIGP